ncbi:hypothetical protein Bbelb_308520 [Branchiostoma belcheri]|nr:hypothetical protein Bbelb_308520 [Branchiostoma belcheri]
MKLTWGSAETRFRYGIGDFAAEGVTWPAKTRVSAILQKSLCCRSSLRAKEDGEGTRSAQRSEGTTGPIEEKNEATPLPNSLGSWPRRSVDGMVSNVDPKEETGSVMLRYTSGGPDGKSASRPHSPVVSEPERDP